MTAALKKEKGNLKAQSSHRKLLLVDDNYDFYIMLKTNVDGMNEADKSLDLDYAPDGFTALHMAKKNKYDAIICDVQMPHLDGIKLVGEFTKKHYSIPFIMISGQLEDKTATEAFQMGAYNVLKKPFLLSELMEKVELAINLHQSEKFSGIHNDEQEKAHVYNMLKMYYYDVEKIILLIQHFQIPLSSVQSEIKKKELTGKCIFDDIQNLKYYSRNDHGNGNT